MGVVHVPRLSLTPRALTAVLAVVAVGATTVGIRASNGEEAVVATQTSTVGRGVVYRTVTASGELAAADDIELEFATSGEVVELNVGLGDAVTEGQVLARIDPADAQDAVEEAEADLDTERARLAETLEGVSPAESRQRQLQLDEAQAKIADANTDLERAHQDVTANDVSRQRQLERAKSDLADEVADQAETSSELEDARDALRSANVARNTAQSTVDDLETRADELDDDLDAAEDDLADAQDDLADAQQAFEDNDCDTTPSPTCDDIQDEIDNANDDVDDANDDIDDAQDEITDLADEQSDAAAELADAEQDVTEAESDVDQLETEVEGFTEQVQQLERSVQDVELDAWNGAVDDARSVANATTAVADAELAYQSQLASNAVADEGASTADVLSGQASVRTAQIAVDNAREDLDETTMVAPADGIISAITADVGDDVGDASASSSSSTTAAASDSTSDSSSSTAFITLTDVSTFDAVMSVNETDIADLEVGQAATVSVDALPDTLLPGEVVSIDPTTSSGDSVVEYEVRVVLTRTAEGLRAGMTVGVDVIAEQVDGALNVPSAAITGTGDSATVTVVADDGTEEQRQVVLGIEGDDATEIVSGVAEGDEVVVAGAAVAGTGAVPDGFPAGGPPGGFGGGGLGGGGRP